MAHYAPPAILWRNSYLVHPAGVLALDRHEDLARPPYPNTYGQPRSPHTVRAVPFNLGKIGSLEMSIHTTTIA